MGHATDSLVKFGTAARYTGAIGATLNLIGVVAVVVPWFTRFTYPEGWQLALAMGIAGISYLVAWVLSYPVQRGNLGAAVALIAIIAIQFPIIFIVSTGCCWGIVLNLWVLATCLNALSEVRFQLRAAKRNRQMQAEMERHGPLAGNAGAKKVDASARPTTLQPPAKSLKRDSGRPREGQ